MCNSGFGGNNCWLTIILVLLVIFLFSGNSCGNNGGCDCGGNNCGCGC